MGLEIVEFIMHTEKKFDLKISNDEASRTLTVGAFTKLCHQKLYLKPNNTSTEEDVFVAIKQILHEHFAIDENIIRREHFFVSDLGLE